MKHRLQFVLLILISQAALAQKSARLPEILQATIDSLRATTSIPGMSFSAVLPDNTVISVHSGVRDLESNSPLTPQTRMLAGSTGKTFFAALAFMAVEKKQISLDDLIYNHLEDKPWIDSLPNAKTITIRMLMNHTSGLEEYYELKDNMNVLINNPEKIWDAEEQIKLLSRRKPLFEAGKGWGYADTNYLVLSVILKKIYTKPLFDEIVQRFIDPHKLTLTEPQRGRDIKNLSNGYTGKNNPFKIEGAVLKNGKHQINPQMEGAGGGFISNSRDLARWAKIYYEADYVSEEIRKQARTGVAARTGRDHQYGLGMQIRPSPNGIGYGHSGWFPGYITDMEFFPDISTSCAIQINTDDADRLKSRNSRYYMLVLLKKCRSSLH
jgi:D-alanyl-D-alanine carboxypeptidase